MVFAKAPSIDLPLGDWRARVSLKEAGGTALTYLTPEGALADRLPKAVALRQRTALAAVKARRKDIERAIAETRVRLEHSFRDGRDWRLADWKVRYSEHPLARTLARGLIWRFSPDDGPQFDALGTAEALTDEDGAVHACPAGGRVRLWHPADSDAAARAAWRLLCLARGVRQPFFQAWRPVYELTPPELQTATYSNRFAGLIFDQPVLVKILRMRGWAIKSRMLDCVPKDFAPARLALPAFGLVAEYWGQGIGAVGDVHRYGAPNLPYFASSQIRFYRESDFRRADRRAVRLEDVPLRAFGEALFDIDMVSGISAVGWLPGWLDPGAEAEPPPPERDMVVDHNDFVDLAFPLLGKHSDGGRTAADTHAFFAHSIDDWRPRGLHDDLSSAVDFEFGGFAVAQVEKSLARHCAFLAAAAGEMTHASEREHLGSVLTGREVSYGFALCSNRAALRAQMAIGIDL